MFYLINQHKYTNILYNIQVPNCIKIYKTAFEDLSLRGGFENTRLLIAYCSCMIRIISDSSLGIHHSAYPSLVGWIGSAI